MFYQYIGVILALMQYSPCSACGWAQYEIDGRCCFMCTPGNHVQSHCTATDITICRACTASTFTDKLNGHRNCSACAVCEQDLGLKTVEECKPFSDTVCGVLEGNYCIDPYEGRCRAARKHTTCKPGQFIKHTGTEYNDTVCENCTENSYSDGSSTSCTLRTHCESKGLSTVKAGDNVSDSECAEKNSGAITAGIVVGIILLLLFVGAALYKSWFHYNNSSPSDSCLDPHKLLNKPRKDILHWQFSVTNSPETCLWTVGGNQSTGRKPTQTQGEHPNSQELVKQTYIQEAQSRCCEEDVVPADTLF